MVSDLKQNFKYFQGLQAKPQFHFQDILSYAIRNYSAFFYFRYIKNKNNPSKDYHSPVNTFKL